MRCDNCHYDLTGLTKHRCPECGRAFDPNDPSTINTGTLSPRARTAIRVTIGVALFLALLAGVITIFVVYSFSSAFRDFHP